MTDTRPPRLSADERRTIAALLQYQRTSLVRKVEGLDEESARRSPVASGTTLLWLMKHIARAEITWLAHRFAGEQGPIPDEVVGPDDTVAAAVARYRATWEHVDAIVRAAPSLDEPCRSGGAESPVNLRWVLMHLLEETARHAGHADILRELIDGETGR
ncbi:MAG TPA: DinB family protein [Acidimicrobiales bacterium]|nr:DinB family protein [Acidimicrobiales bacterium]